MVGPEIAGQIRPVFISVTRDTVAVVKDYVAHFYGMIGLTGTEEYCGRVCAYCLLPEVRGNGGRRGKLFGRSFLDHLCDGNRWPLFGTLYPCDAGEDHGGSLDGNLSLDGRAGRSFRSILQSGKTVIALALLLRDAGVKVASAKAGPDYIDPPSTKPRPASRVWPDPWAMAPIN